MGVSPENSPALLKPSSRYYPTIFHHLALTFEEHKEARIFAFTGQPVARDEVYVGSLAREALALSLFHTGKHWNLGQIGQT